MRVRMCFVLFSKKGLSCSYVKVRCAQSAKPRRLNGRDWVLNLLCFARLLSRWALASCHSRDPCCSPPQHVKTPPISRLSVLYYFFALSSFGTFMFPKVCLNLPVAWMYRNSGRIVLALLSRFGIERAVLPSSYVRASRCRSYAGHRRR